MIVPLVPAKQRVNTHAMVFLRLIGNFVLPPRCPGCGLVVERDHRFCLDCWSSLRFLTDPGCATCSIPLAAADGLICGPCLADPPDHDGIIAAVAYGPVARRMALRLKYARRPGLARTMATLLAPRVAAMRGAVLVPVPLHRWRLWRRGFNQSLEIARGLARLTPLVVMPDVLTRKRATPSLRGMNPSQRRRAVRGAFVVKGDVKGAHIMLVDDVFTTGATINACARALKTAGAARVTSLCWTRVIGDD